MPQTTTLAIRGMSCAACVRHVEQALRRIPGVASVSVDLATGSAIVGHDVPLERSLLAAAVTGAGYDVVPAR